LRPTARAQGPKSIAVLGEEAQLATCASIDLNAVAAGIEAAHESSAQTSIKKGCRGVRLTPASSDGCLLSFVLAQTLKLSHFPLKGFRVCTREN
jgi:hypothetical protein